MTIASRYHVDSALAISTTAERKGRNFFNSDLPVSEIVSSTGICQVAQAGLTGHGGMDRRTFSKLCGMGMTGLALSPWKWVRGAQLPPTPTGVPLLTQVVTIDLGGTAWTLQQAGESEKLPAQVPGDHYSDLLRVGKIPDPYYRDNNTQVQWAAQTGWVYHRTFEVTPEQLAMKNVELVCHGLDTLATVVLNGTKLGSTNNMFRIWIYDVRKILKPGTNDLQIQFQPLPDDAEIKSWNEAYVKLHPQFDLGVRQPSHSGYERGWIRKASYQWGWDWCKPILTMGIWKGIELRAYDSRLANLTVVQHHDPDGSVRLDLEADLASQPASGCQVSARLLEEGAPVREQVAGSTSALSLTVPQPKLWWPNGLGEQIPLHHRSPASGCRGNRARYDEKTHRAASIRSGVGLEGTALYHESERAAVFRQGSGLDSPGQSAGANHARSAAPLHAGRGGVQFQLHAALGRRILRG